MPLTKAVLCGNLEVVRFLLESGYVPEKGVLLLHAIAGHADYPTRLEIARLLLNNGDDVYAADAAGSSVIMLAVKQEAVELVQYILEKYPIDFSQSNPAGETVLSIAQKSGNERLIKLVKQYVFQAK